MALLELGLVLNLGARKLFGYFFNGSAGGLNTDSIGNCGTNEEIDRGRGRCLSKNFEAHKPIAGNGRVVINTTNGEITGGAVLPLDLHRTSH